MSRRGSAPLRVGIRRLIGYPHDVDIAQARRVAAAACALPHDPVTLKLDFPTAARFVALAGRYEASPRDVVAVAVHRFLAAPGDYRPALIEEAAASGLDAHPITLPAAPRSMRSTQASNRPRVRRCMRSSRSSGLPRSAPPSTPTPASALSSSWRVRSRQL
ncbi:hypothetical protein ACFWAY_18490 [Rhodococcus sp. NPDC059968]|uniref:hypothetical protein n=1 Tax=Rhodococcus sp. NPDC059968 TaxID=3347017 RepID=UPI00366D69C6